MNVTAADRVSAGVGRLVKGDIIAIGNDHFEVTGFPQSFAQGRFTVPMRKVDGTNNTRAVRKTFNSDRRFKLVK